MHVPDGFLNPYLCVIMYVVAALFIVWAWKGAKRTLRKSFVPLIAVSSAAILLVQMVEFPAAGGASTWHIMGGTILAMVLGPFGTIISMTITLVIQAAYGDGGISTFGANIVNMAVIGGLSFYLVKALNRKSISGKRLAASLFAAAWISNVLTALAVGIDIGLYPMVGSVGGLAVTIPTMLILYVPTGFAEGIVAASLIVPLSRIKAIKLYGVSLLREEQTKERI
jgi:cobalt/nickel transport system permease protein